MPSSEHLPLVPFHKPFTRIIFFHLWQRDLFPRKIPEQPLYHSATIHRVGSHHAHIFIQTNRTTIERFMMNCTQRQAIRYFTRTMMLLLSDMGCFKGYRGVVVAHIEAADRTLIMCTLVAPPGGTSDRVDGKRCEYQNPSRQRCLPEYWSENAPQGSAAPACRLAYVFLLPARN